MHRYPSAFLSHQRTYLKLKLLKCSDPIPPDVDPSEIRHLIINSGWRICSSGSLDEALCVLPALPMLEVLRLHYMTWDNVSKSSKTILTSSFSHIVQLELSRFGCDTLQELVEILLSFPRLQSLSLDELEETIESVKPALPGLGVSPPFQHLTSLHISLSYAADFVSWLLKIEPLPPISRLSLGEIADSFPIYPDCEPWQDRGILKHQANALVDCQRHFAASIEHVIYRAIGNYGDALHLPALRILEGGIWSIESSLHCSTFGALSTIILHVSYLPSLVDEKHSRPLRNTVKPLLATPPLASVQFLHVVIQEWALYPADLNDSQAVEAATRSIRRELGPEFEERGGVLRFSWSSVGRSW
ncbi:hypothetical protein B0H13DRAFT_2271071, partial [Mycena leptocephala]